MIRPERKSVAEWEASIPDASRRNLRQAAGRIIDAKRRGGSVVVVTGSGPNIHEGVTTLIAELMKKGVVDGVITSSAVVGHEMAGTLDRVKRVVASAHPDLGLPSGILPRGGGFEITLLSEAQRARLESEIDTHWDLYDRIAGLSGDVIIKAAGNMAWPMGPRTESLAREAELLAQEYGLPLETVVGLGADPMTMIGMGARRNLPVIVSTPQLVEAAP